MLYMTPRFGSSERSSNERRIVPSDDADSAPQTDPEFVLPCPHCGEPLKLVPIVFGYPTEQTFEQPRRGEVALGGCGVSDNDPEFACAACHEPLPVRP